MEISQKYTGFSGSSYHFYETIKINFTWYKPHFEDFTYLKYQRTLGKRNGKENLLFIQDERKMLCTIKRRAQMLKCLTVKKFRLRLFYSLYDGWMLWKGSPDFYPDSCLDSCALSGLGLCWTMRLCSNWTCEFFEQSTFTSLPIKLCLSTLNKPMSDLFNQLF